jgi:hypothetical protein
MYDLDRAAADTKINYNPIRGAGVAVALFELAGKP